MKQQTRSVEAIVKVKPRRANSPEKRGEELWGEGVEADEGRVGSTMMDSEG